MIYILSSTHAATGGTELLQQLCYELRKNNVSCCMYYTETYKKSQVEVKFGEMYNNPWEEQILEDSIVVSPETEIDNLYKIRNKFKRIYIWWLSVDNYYGSGRIEVGLLRKIYRKIKHRRNIILFKKSYHLVQSKYAQDYLRDELLIKENIEYLSDYLNLDYLSKINIDLKNKENLILYNPQKGYEYTKKIIAAMPEYKWVALKGFSNLEMKEILAKAKVYIDFGNHPGKDRIPREAAINFCCVLTGKRGAAKNNYDIPILDTYKFDDTEENIENICNAIIRCMNDYEKIIRDFEGYRNRILDEPDGFSSDVRNIFIKKC